MNKSNTMELIFFLKLILILHFDKRTLLTKMRSLKRDNLMGIRPVISRFTSSFGTVEHFIEMYQIRRLLLTHFSRVTDFIIYESLSKNERLNTLKEKLASSEGSTTEDINIKRRRIKRRRSLVKYIN